MNHANIINMSRFTSSLCALILYDINNDCPTVVDLNVFLQCMGSKQTNVKDFPLQQVHHVNSLQCTENTLATYTSNKYKEKID